MRKNKIVGPIPNAGRPLKLDSFTAVLNVRISAEAKKHLETLPRMERGKFVNKLIIEACKAQQ